MEMFQNLLITRYKMPKIYLAIFLFFSVMLSWDAQAISCPCPGSCLRGVTLIPIRTRVGNGPNSFSNPLIGVRIQRCSFFSTLYYNYTFKPGEIKSPNDPFAHHYFARIATRPEVCTNKCTYGAACQDKKEPIDQCP